MEYGSYNYWETGIQLACLEHKGCGMSVIGTVQLDAYGHTKIIHTGTIMLVAVG